MVSPQSECYMAYKIAISGESFVTLTALIWSLPCVNPHMAYKIAISGESFVTMAALM